MCLCNPSCTMYINLFAPVRLVSSSPLCPYFLIWVISFMMVGFALFLVGLGFLGGRRACVFAGSLKNLAGRWMSSTAVPSVFFGNRGFDLSGAAPLAEHFHWCARSHFWGQSGLREWLTPTRSFLSALQPCQWHSFALLQQKGYFLTDFDFWNTFKGRFQCLKVLVSTILRTEPLRLMWAFLLACLHGGGVGG